MSGLDNTSFTVRSVSATTTLTNNDYVLTVDAPAANVLVNLPAVASVQPGRVFIVKRDATATQTVTLDGAGSETINGATVSSLGTEQIFSGGTSISGTVNAFGELVIAAGGVASATVINSDGDAAVFGVSSVARDLFTALHENHRVTERPDGSSP